MTEASIIKKRYLSSFRKYGVNPKALRFRSEVAQRVRFQNLISDIDFKGKTVLDIGCGFGDIIPFIKKKAKRIKYTGVDLVPEFVEIARKKYPNYKFLITDYFGNALESKFDIVLTSGTLNASIKNVLEFRKRAIRVMFEHSREVLVFNMAGGFPRPNNKESYRVWYANSLEILKFCLTLTSKVIFRHHYRKNDFTVVMFR